MYSPAGLLWIGEKYYTPQSFMKEALVLGVSKRIAAIPRNLELGLTWVLLAHPKAVNRMKPAKTNDEVLFEIVQAPGIFTAFIPQRIEKIVPDTITEEEVERLRKRGITPVKVDANDKDHR